MKEYRVEVKPWMTLKSSDGFDFMQKFNDDIPMPLVVMYTSGKLAETKGMVKMSLHGDIKQRVITTCMGCGKPLTNKISQYFGIGPICGGHNYVSPFDTEEELNEAVAAYREKLVNTTWTGFIAKSAIRSIEDENGNLVSIEDLPMLEDPSASKSEVKSSTTIRARIDKPIRCTDDFSVFLTFDYNKEIVASVKALRARFWDPDTKRWEIEYRELNELKSALSSFNWVIENEDIVPDTIELDSSVKFKTNPMSHQVEAVAFGLDHSRFLLADDQGLGKALALDTKLYTPTGYKLMRDIQVGDYVLGRDGKPTQVTAVYDHHNVEMYRFTFSDGVTIDCCKDHLWQIYDQGISKVVPTSWFLEKNHLGKLRKDALRNKTNYNYYIPQCDAVEFNEQSVLLHPYVLGCLLGDGCITNNLSLTSNDAELVEKVNSLLPEGYALNSSESMEDISYSIIGTNYVPGCLPKNIVKDILKQLKLYGCNSHTKFIPDVYKYNSSNIRLAVLQGLLDTDGYATSNNLVQFTSVSKQLALDVQFLVESLGGMAVLSESNCGYNGKITGIQYTLTIRIAEPNRLFTLSRKKSLLNPRRFKPHRNIVKIERIANADARCITVDNSESLYLIDHFVVTHNTKEVIDLALIRKQAQNFKHCLIICCVNSLKWNWLAEIEKHSYETGYILGQRNLKRSGKVYIGSNADKLADLKELGTGSAIDSHYFIITNIESLRNEGVASELKRLCDAGIINMIAADESHRCFDYDSLVRTDAGMLKIGDIVTRNLSVNVASYNLTSHKVEYKPVTSRFQNEVNERLVELHISTSRGVKTIRCTPSHKFYTYNRGWVCASELTYEDDIAELFE